MRHQWTGWTGRAVAILCVLALLSGFRSPADHVPKLMIVLADHAQMVAEHGHSHGLEDDIAWAMHGHGHGPGHDRVDHDHSVAVLPVHVFDVTPVEIAVLWHAPDAGYHPPPVYRQLRPPRA